MVRFIELKLANLHLILIDYITILDFTIGFPLSFDWPYFLF